MTNIIPFPVNPRAARADVFRPEWTAEANELPVFRQAHRADGVPLRPGDSVRVNLRNGGYRDGIILQSGIKGAYSEQRTYLVQYPDSTRQLTTADFIESAERRA